MIATEPSTDRTAPASQTLLRTAALATFASCAFAMPTPLEPARVRSAPAVHACGDPDVTPHIAVSFVAAPAVTTPQASVARFSLDVLPVVAAVVDVRLAERVLLSRIGGLYGP